MSDDLNLILRDYDEAALRTGGVVLGEWTERYPQFAREIVEYAVESHVMEGQVWERPDPAAEALFLERARAVRDRFRDQSPNPIPGFIPLARERGLSPVDLARKLGLGIALLTKLERRLIESATVPKALMEQLAAEIGRRADDVAAYLQKPSALSAQASYRSAEAPRITAQESFADALVGCPGMTEEQREYWRSKLDRPLGGED